MLRPPSLLGARLSMMSGKGSSTSTCYRKTRLSKRVRALKIFCCASRACPFQGAATDPKPMIEAFALNTTGGSLGTEIERVCLDNELVILTWSPIHLRDILQELYWKGTQIAASAVGFFEDTLRYLYLSRLKSWDALHQAIRALAQPAETSSARPTVRMAGRSKGFSWVAAMWSSTTRFCCLNRKWPILRTPVASNSRMRIGNGGAQLRQHLNCSRVC